MRFRTAPQPLLLHQRGNAVVVLLRQRDRRLGRLERACENAGFLVSHLRRGDRAIEPLLVEIDHERKRFGIEGREKIADCDLLIVGDVDVADDAGYLGGDLHEVGSDVGV